MNPEYYYLTYIARKFPEVGSIHFGSRDVYGENYYFQRRKTIVVTHRKKIEVPTLLSIHRITKYFGVRVDEYWMNSIVFSSKELEEALHGMVNDFRRVRG